MNCSYNLSLPTTIPWERICVSEDMLDPIPCDAELPPKWQSSIAAFKYDPADEYQPYEKHLISFIKLIVTITPYAPEIKIENYSKYVPPVLINDLEEAFPCYGALLQVSVFPKKEDNKKYSKSNYPYFIDFEPKKRELYELVTDTGEILSGSSTTLSVGKSSTTTDSTENYNLDTGWNFGIQGGYKGTGGGVSVGKTEQVGTISSSGLQRSDIRTSEESTERRERHSHTTQLSQMYNLFQAFHLGTNRALFLMEPRPHIRQSEATFINGPRALEGIQEIFMIVVRPKEMKNFCINAVLETAHLTKEPKYEYETKTEIIQFRLFAKAKNMDTTAGETDWTETVAHSESYTPPAGWEIDLSKGKGGYDYRILRQQRRKSGPTFTVTSNGLSVYGEVTWRFWETGVWNDDHYEDGYLDVDVTIYIRKKTPKLKEYVRKLFFSSRDLCCCPHAPVFIPEPWITYDIDLSKILKIEFYHGYGNNKSFLESRKISSKIREEIIRSINSSRRMKRGALSYDKSDAFYTRISDLLITHRVGTELDKPIESTDVMPINNQQLIHQKLGSISLSEVLLTDAVELAKCLNISVDKVLSLKDQTIQTINTKVKSRDFPKKQKRKKS